MVRASRLASVVLLATLASCLSSSNSINLYGGVRQLEDGAYDDVDEPTYYGADAVIAFDDQGLLALGAELGLGRSEDDDSGAIADEEIDIQEYYGGLRLFFPVVPIVKPYVSAGLSLVDAEFDDGQGNSFDDDGVVPYIRAGLAGQLAFVRLGVDLRYLLDSDLDLGPADNVEGLIPTVFVGIAF